MVSKHCFGTAASAFEIIKLDIFTVLQRTISALLWLRRVLHVFHWSVGNYLCARSQLQTQSMRLGNWKVPLENRNHDWSKKWLQQNSRYAVKLITKGGFITASRSQARLSLQRQLHIKFNLSMRQTIDLVTVFDAILTSRQTREKLQCLYENLISNNFRRSAVLKKIWFVN